MEFISVKDEMPKGIAGIFLVRTENGNEIKAYYYEDAMAWIAFYGQKTSHWWEVARPHGRIDNVTHWKPLNKKKKQNQEKHEN